RPGDVSTAAPTPALCLQKTVDLIDPGRVVHDDLDGDGPRASVGDPHLVDRRGGERMDRHRPALEGDPGPTFGEVQCIRDSEDTGFKRERLSVRTVARDRLQ